LLRLCHRKSYFLPCLRKQYLWTAPPSSFYASYQAINNLCSHYSRIKHGLNKNFTDHTSQFHVCINKALITHHTAQHTLFQHGCTDSTTPNTQQYASFFLYVLTFCCVYIIIIIIILISDSCCTCCCSHIPT
jgi:hypothetical protein